jgi:hypothetical protein
MFHINPKRERGMSEGPEILPRFDFVDVSGWCIVLRI